MGRLYWVRARVPASARPKAKLPGAPWNNGMFLSVEAGVPKKWFSSVTY